MQRPVMNPTFLNEQAPSAPSRKRQWLLAALLLPWRTLKLIFRVLTYDPLSRRGRLRIEDGTPLQRFIRGIAYRVAFAPVFIAGVTCLIVYTATHPNSPYTVDQTPSTLDVYYEPVTFLSSDGVSLDGLLFPALEAKHVVADKEKALRKRSPAVVLVHDFGATRRQMLPLVRPLHDAGFVVLAMNTRGNGASGAVGQTYGLNEALDVKAGVEMLRRRTFVDPSRISVLGYGTGASAALLTAKRDSAIRALVLGDPLFNGLDAVLDGRLGPPQEYLSFLRPLCKWTFEIAYRVDADDLEWSEFREVLEKRSVLMIGEDGKSTDFTKQKHVDEICAFLARTLVPEKAPVALIEK
jgi:pimeloyl-ACP methyl ester carboxylesterase